MTNSADLRGYYISTEAEGDLQNSSNHTQPHSIIIAKYYLGQTSFKCDRTKGRWIQTISLNAKLSKKE